MWRYVTRIVSEACLGLAQGVRRGSKAPPQRPSAQLPVGAQCSPEDVHRAGRRAERGHPLSPSKVRQNRGHEPRESAGARGNQGWL